MAQDEVWGATEQVDGGSDPSFGEPDYDNGVPANTAFAVDAVFRYGMAWIQEQPQVGLLGGLNFVGLMILTGIVSFGLNMGLVGMGASGTIDQQAVDVLSQLTGLIVQTLAWPFNQLVLAGLMVAGALWVQAEQSRTAALYTSVRPAVRGLLAGLVAGMITLVVVLFCFTPAMLALFLMIEDDVMNALAAFGVLLLPALPVLIYVGLGLMLAPYAAVLDQLGPMEAIQRSWDAANGTRLTLFVTNLVFGILGGIAACMCYIPLVVVIPIQVMGLSAAWLRYARPEAETGQWAFFQRNG